MPLGVPMNKANPFKDGLSKVMLQGLWGFINEKGDIMNEIKFSEARDFSDGLARVLYKDGYSFIDKKGFDAFDATFLYASDFNEGVAVVETESGVGVIDKSGNFIIECGIYDYIAEDIFADGLIVGKGDKFGVVDLKGNIVLDITYDAIG